MLAIATYVVVEPSDRDELLEKLLRSIAKATSAPLTIELVDDKNGPPIREIEFFVRQTDHDGLGNHFFAGFVYDEKNKYLLYLTIPPWENEPASIKLGIYND
jgi:hypothetical protein